MSSTEQPDYQALATRLDALAQAVTKLETARTSEQKTDARDDVESAEAALERYARANGISVEDAAEAISAVKRNAQKSQMREILEEIFQEDEKKAEEDARAAEAAAKDDPKPEEKDKPKPKLAPVDSTPEGGSHWTDRRIGG